MGSSRSALSSTDFDLKWRQIDDLIKTPKNPFETMVEKWGIATWYRRGKTWLVVYSAPLDSYLVVSRREPPNWEMEHLFRNATCGRKETMAVNPVTHSPSPSSTPRDQIYREISENTRSQGGRKDRAKEKMTSTQLAKPISLVTHSFPKNKTFLHWSIILQFLEAGRNKNRKLLYLGCLPMPMIELPCLPEYNMLLESIGTLVETEIERTKPTDNNYLFIIDWWDSVRKWETMMIAVWMFVENRLTEGGNCRKTSRWKGWLCWNDDLFIYLSSQQHSPSTKSLFRWDTSLHLFRNEEQKGKTSLFPLGKYRTFPVKISIVFFEVTGQQTSVVLRGKKERRRREEVRRGYCQLGLSTKVI